MKIKTNFKDYYDKVYSEWDNVWVRKKNNILISNPFDFWFQGGMIGVGGEYFPFYACDGESKYSYKPYYLGEKLPPYRGYHMHMSKIICGDHRNENMEKIKLLPWINKFGPVFLVNFTRNPLYHGDVLNQHFHDAFIQPKWGSHKINIIINPTLENFGFQNILSPYDTYKKIEKWVMNNPLLDEDVPEMENDLKIEQAGFDLKTSFRKGK